jgi:hypothetical protein
MQHVEHILVTVSTTSVCKLYANWAVVSTFTCLHMHFLLMSTLHASVCMHVTANILMLTLHVACVSMYTKFIVHTDINLHAYACFADVDLACISLYNCHWYILTLTLHVACISMNTNFVVHTDVDISCVSVYVCILC